MSTTYFNGELITTSPSTTTNDVVNPTSTESPTMMTTLATILFNFDGSPSSNQREHLEHNKITFEIPNHHDLEHIDSMHKFNTLLKRIGNVALNDASQPFSNVNNHLHQYQSQEHLLTNSDISKSVVLDLADLKGNNDNSFGFERFFDGADMHSIINYLWIGVVTSLIILSIIFIVFSCYFYRKFREWKKCNKDIRAHLNGNNNNTEIIFANGTTSAATAAAPAVATTVRTYYGQQNDSIGYYQMESPPCYTIATGLPSYDEALLHHYHNHHQHHHHHHRQQQQQQLYHYQQQQRQQKQHGDNLEKQKHPNYFDYALKYMCTTAIQSQQQQQQQQHDEHLFEQQPLQQLRQQQQQQNANAVQHQHHHDDMMSIKKCMKISDSTDVSTSTGVDGSFGAVADNEMLQYCCSVDHKNNKITNIQKESYDEQRIKISSLLMESICMPSTAYDITAATATMALLNDHDVDIIVGNDYDDDADVDVERESMTPVLLNDEKMDNIINICTQDESKNEELLNFSESSSSSSFKGAEEEGEGATAKSSISTIFSQTNKIENNDESLNSIIIA